MKDVSEKLRMAVVGTMEGWNQSPSDIASYLPLLSEPDTQASKLFNEAVEPILAELDELAELKRLLIQAGLDSSYVHRMEYHATGHGWIYVNRERKVPFGPGKTYDGPLEALRSLLPPPEEVVSTNMKKVFSVDDLVLSKLKLPDPCPVRIEIRNECVYLHVGPRDWQWRLSDASFVGSGCGLSCKNQENPPPAENSP